ncbi:hypothetical protein JCM11251_001502 [Rhodosporidiobolus azoricus]
MTYNTRDTSPTPTAVDDTAHSLLIRRSLRQVASTSSLPALPYTSRKRQGVTRGQTEQPSLAELIRVEAEREEVGRPRVVEEVDRRTRPRRRSSAPLPGHVEARAQANDPAAHPARPSSALPSLEAAGLDRLLPPHYGRPSRPSSPDVLATLLRPVLASLTRPSSPLASPGPSSPTSSSPFLQSAAPAQPAASSLPAHFPPREATDPAPTVESQGFVLYIGSLVAFFAYLVWAVLPGYWLEAVGIEWYPSQEWALLVPAWVVMLVVFTYSSYFFLNMSNTPPLSSLSIFGSRSKGFISPPPPPLLPDGTYGPEPIFAHSVLWDEDAIPPLYDLPVEWVNRVFSLYLPTVMAALQDSAALAARLPELLTLRERLTKDLKLAKKGNETGAAEHAPLDYAAAFSLLLAFTSSLPTAVAASSGGKTAKGPVPTTTAFEALEFILRRALSVLTLPFLPSELASVRQTFTRGFLLNLATTLYNSWDTHLPSAQQKLKSSLALILSLSSPSVLSYPEVAQTLREKILVDRWGDSKRTLHTFEVLLPHAKVEDFGDFAVGEGDVAEGVLRRLAAAMVANEEMAQLTGKVALAWAQKVWDESLAAKGKEADVPHLFWIRPSLESMRMGGPKARHSVLTYVLHGVFGVRKEGFKAILKEGGYLFEDDGEDGLKGKDEDELETALAILRAGNAANLVELDLSASAATSPHKIALPTALLSACLTHSSTSLRTSALSLLVLSPSSSISFPLSTFSLLRTFYTYSLGEEDGEMKMQTLSLTGKLLLRLRDSSWKMHRVARKGKDGSAAAAEYVEQVKDFVEWFLALLVKENLNPARPYRIKITSIRLLDLAFQARVDPYYRLEEDVAAATIGAAGVEATGTEAALSKSKNTTTGYSTYRKQATTQAPMFNAKHRKMERNDQTAPSSTSTSTSSPAPFRPSSPAALPPQPRNSTSGTTDSGWPFPISLVNSETTQVLLRQLLSTYTALRFLALSMLERFPAPLPGYEEEAGAEKAKKELLGPALKMIRSGREAEASAGAGVIGLLWRKWGLDSVEKGRQAREGRWMLGEVGGWQEGAETKTGPAGFAFISSLLDLTEQQLFHYSSNLSEASSVAPMHGTLLALRHLFISIPVSSYPSLSSTEERRALFHRALGVIRRVWEVTSPVLAARAPEGGEGKEGEVEEEEADTEEARAIRFEQQQKKAAGTASGGETKEAEDGELLADGTGGPQHKIILSACWRAMKEAGELLETILRLPSELGTVAFRQVWSYNEIRAIGDLYGDWLARIRHRGAFMAVHPCYTRAAAALLAAGKEWPEVGKLPEEWLDSHLDAIVSKRISFTRRSAGIPYLILGLLLTILPSSRSTFDRALSRLFEIAESTTDDISDSSRVHAINTVRTVFLDAKGGLAASAFIERGFLVSISLFFSPNWILRNVAMMLFASLTQRALNAKRTNLDRDPVSLSKRLSVDEFFGRYPALKQVLREQLERGWKESLEDLPSSNLHSSLFSILMLLSLLQTPKRIGSTSTEPPLSAPFIPLVQQCASSRVWKIREVAADALTGMIAPDEVGAKAEELLSTVERDFGGLSSNELHGRLLQVLSLLEGAVLLEGDEAQRVCEIYLRLCPSILPSVPADSSPLRPQHPFAVLTSFLSISLRLPINVPGTNSPSVGSLAAAYLDHAESWDQSAYHLPSTEEFLHASWLVAYTTSSYHATWQRGRRQALIVGGLNGRSIEVKRAALEALETELLVVDEEDDTSSIKETLLRVILSEKEAGDVRVSAADLLSSPRLSSGVKGNFLALKKLYERTPIVPLREAVLPLVAGAATEEAEQVEALQLVDEASVADQTVESREAAGLALIALSRSFDRNVRPSSRRPGFAHVTMRMLQDDDVTVRTYALEAFGPKLVEGKAVETVLQEGGEEVEKMVVEEESDELGFDLDVLANPSSLLFAIEKPNIFLDPFLVPRLLSTSLTASLAAEAWAQFERLGQAIEAGRGLEEGPLGRGGNELVQKWDTLPRLRLLQTASIAKDTLAILGGGLSGLSTAYYTLRTLSPQARAATRIVLLEKEERTGGWIKAVRVQDLLVFETGPRSIRPVGLLGWLTVDLAHSLGLTPRLITVPKTAPSARNRYLFTPPSLTKLPSSLPSAISSIFTTGLMRRVVPPLLLEPFRPRSRLHEQADGGDESVDSFFARRFGKPLAEDMASAMIHGIYAGDSRRLSVRAVFPQLWEAEREWGSVILAGLFGGLARRRGWKTKSAWRLAKEAEDGEVEKIKSGLKASGAEGEELVKGIEGASVWGVKGGLEELTAALEEKLRNEGVEFWMGERGKVEKTEKVDGGWQITTSSTELKASHLVTTIPTLLPTALATPPLPSTTVSVINLSFPRPPTSSPPLFPPGFGYLIPRTVPTALNPHHALGVLFDSDVMPGVDGSASPSSNLVKISLLLGGSYWLDCNPTPQPSHDELVSATLETLRLHFPSTTFPEPIHAFSHTHRDCIPQVPPNSLPAFRAFAERLREAGNVAVVGGGFAAVGVNGCVKSAWEVGRSMGESMNASVARAGEKAAEKSANAVEPVRTGTEMWEI